MISIAIVEDEEMYAKQLQQFLHQYEKENKEMFDITVYSDCLLYTSDAADE